ncbi:MAG TPA: hypothetical protein VNA16_10350, partial [Abditibacteriaceae bacterium]|nr:hypothetical protein [Abditibacteriaceae bacterium]
MTREELLHELESLTHDARMSRMVEIGRSATTDASVEATLSELECGGHYERRLALQSCFGSRDGARVVRALDDLSRLLRGLALRLAILVCDDAQLQQVLLAAPFKRRRALLQKAVKRRRHAAIDAFLETLTETEERDLERLLPYGSAAFVSRHLELLRRRAGQDDWRRLARFHPHVAAAALLREAQAAARLDARLVWQANAVLPFLAESHPDRALEVVRALLRFVPLDSLPLQRLAERRPAAVADLLLATQQQTHISFQNVAHRLDIERLLALVKRYPGSLEPQYTWFPGQAWRWLRDLDPDRRLAVYRVCERGWRDADGVLAHDLVTLLPRAEREAEARRHWRLPTLATRPAQRLPYASFLPYAEARALLDPFLRNPDPALRAAALTNLTYGVRFERDRLPDLLALILARQNEQDPIRGAMLNGLASLPPATWQPAHLDDLGQVIRHALNAPDLSQSTAGAAECLIIALLPRYPDWAAQWLATVVRERGLMSFQFIGDRLSDADVKNIAPSLLPVLQSWETREREGQILAFARSLGRRLRVWDELANLLERVLRNTHASLIAGAALELLAEHRRDHVATLIPELLREDPSWITQSTVYNYVHRRRQDLITDFLGRQAYKGRFSTGRTRFVLPLHNGFARWLPVQQELFEQTLGEVIQDEARDSPALLGVINQLALLPDVPPTRLVQLADVRNPKQVTRDAALRALGRRDNGDGVPVLIEALGDERARIAIYTLRGALLEMPASRALELLRAVPVEKVTVAKEVVRLLGELKSDDAYETLLEWDERDLHRDVRVALLRALWNHLEKDATWPVLEVAAVSSDAAVATIVGRIPVDRLSPEAARRVTALVATLLEHPDPQVRLDVLSRCGSMPLADTEQVLLQPLLNALNSPLPDECVRAVSAVFNTYVGREAEFVGTATRRILSNRRALHTMVTQLRDLVLWSGDHLLPTARAVLDVLATDSLTVRWRVELAVNSLPTEELAALFSRLAEQNELHAEALSAATTALESGELFRENDEFMRLEAMLAAAPDERLRRVALAALIAACQSPHGWS